MDTAKHIRMLMEVIRKLREETHPKQKNFAYKVEINKTHYSELEWSGTDMKVSTLEKICKGLHKSPWAVMRLAWENKVDFESDEGEVEVKEVKKKRKKKVRIKN